MLARRQLGACLLSVLLAACASSPSSLSDERITIDHVTVLDGRGGASISDARVVVRGDRIESVSRSSTAAPGKGRLIDGSGKFLLPGFIDMHAHLLMPRCDGTFDRELSGRMVEQLIDFGITTVRSPGNPTIEGLAFRDQLNAGAVRGPRAIASAEILNDPSMTPEAIRAYVRNALPYRPDYFKFHSRFPPESVAVLVEAAHAKNIPVIGHLQRTSTVQAIRLGVDQVTHAADWSPDMLRPENRAAYAAARAANGPIKARLDWLELLDLDSPEVSAAIEALRSSGTSMDPTLVAYDSKFRDPASPRYRANPYVDRIPTLSDDWRQCQAIAEDWTQADYGRWTRLWPKLLEYVRRLHDAGVLLTTGSDVTNPWVIPGESIHQEMEFLVESGIPPSEVLRMSGENAARALGRGNIGIVEDGRRADLILLSADPRISISNTRSIDWVMQGGRIVSRRSSASKSLTPSSLRR